MIFLLIYFLNLVLMITFDSDKRLIYEYFIFLFRKYDL